MGGGGSVSQRGIGRISSKTAGSGDDGRTRQGAPTEGDVWSLVDIGRPGKGRQVERGQPFVDRSRRGGLESCGEEEVAGGIKEKKVER